MKICDFCNKEINNEEKSIEISKWVSGGDCETDFVLFQELHDGCADDVIKLIKKYKKDLQIKGKEKK